MSKNHTLQPSAQPEFLTASNLSQTAPACHPLRAITTRVDPVLPKMFAAVRRDACRREIAFVSQDQAPEVRTLIGISLAGKPRGVSRNRSVL